MLNFCALAADFRGLCDPIGPFSGAAGALCPSSAHHGPPGQIKIAQPDQREHLRGVLGQPLVAHLGVAELALDDAKHVLNPGPNRGHLAVEALVGFTQGVLFAGLERYTPEHVCLLCLPFDLVVDVSYLRQYSPARCERRRTLVGA